MTGDLWSIPGGHKAIEVEGSTRDILRLAVIPPDWPWLKPPIDVARVLCTPLPMKYYGGKVPNTKEN